MASDRASPSSHPAEFIAMSSRTLLLTLLVCFGASPLGYAGIIFDEATNAPGGVFSRNNLSPTIIPTLGLGNNDISGVIEGAGGTPVDVDIFTVTVPSGTLLVGVYLPSYVTVDQFAYTGIDIGNTFPVPVLNAGSDTTQFIGGTLLGPDVQFVEPLPPNPPFPLRNLLPSPYIGFAFNGTGQIGQFSTLGAGDYTFLVQQSGEYTDYTLRLTVAAVPEPSSAVMLLPALASVLSLRRRGVRRG